MSNPSKQKGTAFESLIAAAFAEVFPGVERRALAGAADRGDIGGVPGLVVECKNVRTMSLGVWVDEARAEAANAGEPYGVVVHKRARVAAAEEQFVTMPLGMFLQLWLERCAR